jgi:hypothetical protein
LPQLLRWTVQRTIFHPLDEPVPALADPFPRDDPLPGAYELRLPADDVTIWYTVTEHEGRLGEDASLKTLPQLRKAAKKVAAAVDVLVGTPPTTEDGEPVSVAGIWSAIEQVVPRDQLADALACLTTLPL